MKILPNGKKAWTRFAVIVGLAFLIPLAGGCFMFSMPGESFQGDLEPLSEVQKEISGKTKKHVKVLADDIGPRHLSGRTKQLRQAAEYVKDEFTSLGHDVKEIPYEVRSVTVRNIEATIPGSERPDEVVVIGAHYDSVPNCPAANDNGTGVAALIELARLAGKKTYSRTLKFAAFPNEEPPFFQTEEMGSRAYARYLETKKTNVVGMIALETIGCYTDEPESQQYPFPLSLFYPDKGNFIAFVGNFSSRSLTRRCIRVFREKEKFPSEGAVLPASLPGAGWSDHWSFWQSGYPAVMVTDTAVFRYRHYHRPSDTPDKIDFDKMSRVVTGIDAVISELAGLKN